MHAPVGMHDLEDVPSLVKYRENIGGLNDADRERRVHGSGQPLGQAMTGIVELGRIIILEYLGILGRIRDRMSTLRHIRDVGPLPHSVQVRFPIGKARDRRGGLRGAGLTWRQLFRKEPAPAAGVRCEQAKSQPAWSLRLRKA